MTAKNTPISNIKGVPSFNSWPKGKEMISHSPFMNCSPAMIEGRKLATIIINPLAM